MSNLPTDTLTFLFTDVEGSTRLWERHEAIMHAVTARHDALLDRIIVAHGGQRVRERGEGDSLFAVFARPGDAVAAALAMTRALLAEPWPAETPILVRMGLHTGSAQFRAGDYYGPVVNRCARIRGLGHGGQVLLSAATAALVRDALPAGAGLRPLGAHPLRGLSTPEDVYQLCHPDLPVEFPPLLSPQAPRHNLPSALTPLIGREAEQGDVLALLAEARLVTLVGTGGVGKTRLALAVAAELVDQYPDGVWLVELAALAEGRLVAQTVLETLGTREEAGRPLLVTLADRLRDRRLLLVLDNCEHLVAACAALVEAVLRRCPGVRVLATSRAVLHLQGERHFTLAPLALPAGAEDLSAETIGLSSAVVLFVQRAKGIKPEFTLTAENAATVARICQRLDGLPLALELSAARIKLLSPRALLARLERGLHVLTGGARDLPERHQTMRATIAWSHDLLEESDRALFRRLAAFVGGFTLDALEAVCYGAGYREDAALEQLESLLDHSLLRAVEQTDGEPRFLMLETIREYGLECLETSGEVKEIRRSHARYFLTLAEAAEPALWGAAQTTWLGRLEADIDNLRSASRWAVEVGDLELGLRLGGALWRFWRVHGRTHEGLATLQELLARRQSSPHTDIPALVHAKALSGAGTLAAHAGDFPRATILLEESAKLYREQRDRPGLAGALLGLGPAIYWQGEYQRATMLLEEGLALYRDLGDRQRLPEALHYLGMMMLTQGNLERARSLIEESVVVCTEQGDRAGRQLALSHLASIARAEGNLNLAMTLEEEGLTLAREVGDIVGVAQQLNNRGRVAILKGDMELARASYAEGLALPWDKRNLWGVAFYLEGVAGVAAGLGQVARAARLLGAAEALHEAVNAPAPLYEHDLLEHTVALIRGALDVKTLASEWAVGRTLPVEQAVATARELVQAAPHAVT